MSVILSHEGSQYFAAAGAGDPRGVASAGCRLLLASLVLRVHRRVALGEGKVASLVLDVAPLSWVNIVLVGIGLLQVIDRVVSHYQCERSCVTMQVRGGANGRPDFDGTRPSGRVHSDVVFLGRRP